MTAKQIAIDGPAGAGKSTIAKLVAERLGYIYIDTGAMYRAVALCVMRQQVDVADLAALKGLLQEIKIDLDSDNRIFLNGEDVSREIRLPEVGNMASVVSAIPEVRKALVRQQQEMAAQRCVVMDGRDIGRDVLPQAECKIFLTASSLVRAQRRTAELQEKGLAVDLEQIQREIEERDYRDSHRAISPLCMAEDAVLVDSSEMSISEVLEQIIAIAEAKA